MTSLIEQRQATHGDFEQGAEIFSALTKHIDKAMINGQIDNNQYYALTMMTAKITRILNGKADFRDHWEDLANYAILGGRLKIQDMLTEQASIETQTSSHSRVLLNLPRPLSKPRKKMWYIRDWGGCPVEIPGPPLDGPKNSAHIDTVMNRYPFFDTEQEAQEWLSAMRNSRK